tara:strand:+ start:5379 stop:6053 length:675 start_codon:yes stop_codon:yes gene_type:complete
MNSNPMVIPVIHYHDDDQAMRNAQIVADAGCKAVMLIEMQGNDPVMVSCAKRVKEANPDLLVGVNCLSASASFALAMSIKQGFDMTWTDKQVTHSSLEDGHIEAEHIGGLLETSPAHLFFAGVAFKHQPYEPRPNIAARRAVEKRMIPTTSGIATGVSADTSFIEALRSSLPENAPLGIASGVTPENVSAYAPHVSHILVSTGISSSFHELDQARLEALMKRVG